MSTWNIADAKAHLSAVLKEGEKHPQIISRRNKPVAVIMNMNDFNESQAKHAYKISIKNSFEQLRMIQKTEKQVLDIPERKDREFEI